LDSGIVSAQTNVLGFLQSRISMLIDLLWSILNKTPITKQPQTATEGQLGQQPYSLESLKGLWTAYGPVISGGLSKSFSKSTGGPSPDITSKATYASGAELNHDGGQGGHERKSVTP